MQSKHGHRALLWGSVALVVLSWMASLTLSIQLALITVELSLIVAMAMQFQRFSMMQAIGWLLLWSATLLLWRFLMAGPDVSDALLVFAACLIAGWSGCIVIVRSQPQRIAEHADADLPQRCDADTFSALRLHLLCAVSLLIPLGTLWVPMLVYRYEKGRCVFLDDQLQICLCFNLGFSLLLIGLAVLCLIFVGWFLVPVIALSYWISLIRAMMAAYKAESRPLPLSLSPQALWGKKNTP